MIDAPGPRNGLAATAKNPAQLSDLFGALQFPATIPCPNQSLGE